MASRKSLVLVALAASALAPPVGARAWVAVGVSRVAVAPVGAVAFGVAAGAVAGAAVASASPPPPQTVVVQPPPVQAPPPTVAPAGSTTTTLPPGCVQSGSRYQCGSVFYQPYFGSNGVYYHVVAQ
jgi:hypothetical protein